MHMEKGRGEARKGRQGARHQIRVEKLGALPPKQLDTGSRSSAFSVGKQLGRHEL